MNGLYKDQREPGYENTQLRQKMIILVNTHAFVELGTHRPRYLTQHLRTQIHTGPTRVILFDLGEKLEVDYAATSPNLLAAYVRIVRGESIQTAARATSQCFYVIRGQGITTSSEHGR